MTIVVSRSLHVEPSQRQEYFRERIEIIAHARKEPGCIDFSLSSDLLDTGRINVYQRWRSHDDFLAYCAGDGPGLHDRIALIGADVELHHIKPARRREHLPRRPCGYGRPTSSPLTPSSGQEEITSTAWEDGGSG